MKKRSRSAAAKLGWKRKRAKQKKRRDAALKGWIKRKRKERLKAEGKKRGGKNPTKAELLAKARHDLGDEWYLKPDYAYGLHKGPKTSFRESRERNYERKRKGKKGSRKERVKVDVIIPWYDEVNDEWYDWMLSIDAETQE